MKITIKPKEGKEKVYRFIEIEIDDEDYEKINKLEWRSNGRSIIAVDKVYHEVLKPKKYLKAFNIKQMLANYIIDVDWRKFYIINKDGDPLNYKKSNFEIIELKNQEEIDSITRECSDERVREDYHNKQMLYDTNYEKQIGYAEERKIQNKSQSVEKKDNRWIEKKKIILERDNYTCVFCESRTLVERVAKINYNVDKNIEIWNYPNEYLVTCCLSCQYKEVYKGKIHYQNLKIDELKQELKN